MKERLYLVIAIFLIFPLQCEIIKTYKDFEEIPIENRNIFLPEIVNQSYWIKNNLTIATGVEFKSSEDGLEHILSEIYDATDYLGEPLFEDLKMIKWEIQDTTKSPRDFG
jgi:hypothetical protein